MEDEELENDLQNGGWQIDEKGRKFRRVGKETIEYMPMITIDGHEMEYTPETVNRYHEAKQKAEQQARDAELNKQREAATGKICPMYANAPMAHECKRDCALFVGDSCAFAARPATVDTQGKPCPFMRQCKPSCALYNNGCTLINIKG